MGVNQNPPIPPGADGVELHNKHDEDRSAASASPNALERGSPVYAYKIHPIGYPLLPEEEQEAIIDSFRALLDKLEKPTQFIVRRVVVRIEDEEVPGYEFYVVSEQRLDNLLSRAGIRFEPLLEPPPPIINEHCEIRRTFAICGGRVYRVVTIYALPRVLAEGFLYNLYHLIDEVRVYVLPLRRYTAFKLLQSRRKLLEMLAASWELEGKAPRLDKLEELQRVQELLDGVVNREYTLHAVRVALLVSGATPEEAKTRAKALIAELESLGFEAEDATTYYYKVYSGDEPRPLYVDSVTLSTFFPFITTQLIEAGGVYLGRSLLDESPVVLNLWSRLSYNVVVLGVMGSGKSAFAKKLVYQYSRTDPDLAVFIVDRTGEYTPLANVIGAEILEARRGEPLGLDPARLLPPEHAAALIASILGLESGLRGELARLLLETGSLEEAAGRASGELHKRLVDLLEGPLGFIFKGEPPKVERRAVLVLSGLEGSPEAEQLVGALGLLVFLRRVRDLPRQTRKVIVVDEFMQVLEGFRDYDVISYLLQFFRDSRKLYTAVIHIAHDPREVAASRAGRVIAAQLSAVKALFRHDYDAAQASKELFGLTEQEVEILLSAETGDALLLTEGLRLPVHIVLKEEEQELFETRPWATAGSGSSKPESGHGG